jgi:threonine dehydrogenase-like Zn-dependent dehydrogenase
MNDEDGGAGFLFIFSLSFGTPRDFIAVEEQDSNRCAIARATLGCRVVASRQHARSNDPTSLEEGLPC